MIAIGSKSRLDTFLNRVNIVKHICNDGLVTPL